MHATIAKASSLILVLVVAGACGFRTTGADPAAGFAPAPVLPIPVAAPSSGNLVRNPSFEVGFDGYGFERGIDLAGGCDAPPMPPVLDAAEHVHGQVSLRIDNPRADALRLTMREVALAPGVKHTMAVWMKASVPGMNLYIDLRGNERGLPHSGAGKTCALTTAWQRYSFAFTPPADHTHYYAEFHLNTGHCGAICTVPGSIWIDAVQIVAGDLPPAFSSGAVELGVEPVSGRFLAGRVDEAFPVLVRFFQEDPSRPESRLRWRVIDDRADLVVRSGELPLPAAAAGASTLTLPDVAPRRRGSFRLEAHRFDAQATVATAAVASAALHFAVVDPVPAVAGLTGPMVGFNSSLDVRVVFGTGWRNRQILCQYGFSAGTSVADLTEAAGQRWVRDWGCEQVINWRTIESEEGRFDWTMADRMVAEAERRGIRLLPVLGGMWQLKTKEADKPWDVQFLPDWALARTTLVPPVYPVEAEKGWRAPWPIPDGFIRFVGACASRYRGRIPAWEVANEPNVALDATQYTTLLKAAYQAIKAADPAATVVGFCATGDFNSSILAFIDDCCKLGALEWCDAVSFHPYGAPLDWSSPYRAEDMHAKMRALLDRHGGQAKQLWNTECYYLGRVKPIDQNRVRGHEMARHFLLDLADGIAQSMPIHASYLIRQERLTPHFAGTTLGELVPSHYVPIYNTLAREFAGGRLLRRFTLPGRNQLLLFERGGAQVAATWNYADQDRDGVLILPGAVGSVNALDMMGNPLDGAASADGRDLSFALGHDPVYLKPAPGIAADAFAGLLAGARVRGSELFKLDARTSQGDHGAVVVIEVENTGDAPVQARMDIIAPEHAFTAAAPTGPVTVPAYGSTSVIRPITPAATWTAAVPATIRLESGGDRKERMVELMPPPPAAVCPSLGAAPHIDGRVDADEWRDAARIVIGGRRQIVDGKPESWGGPEDCSAQVRVGWDQQHLYLAFQVADAGRGERRSPPWVYDGDACEVFLDLDPDHRLAQTGYTDRTCQLLLGLPTAKISTPTLIQGGRTLRVDIMKLKAATSARADGYDEEIAIPWTQLGVNPAPGLVLGFDVAVDDADPPQDGRKIQLAWAGDAKNCLNRARFGRLVLGGTAGGR